MRIMLIQIGSQGYQYFAIHTLWSTMDFRFIGVTIILLSNVAASVKAVSCTWTSWSACSVTCGGSGTRRRYYNCCYEANEPIRKRSLPRCIYEDSQSQSCTTFPCVEKVDGVWSSWNSWSGCSVSCGAGTKRQERFCNNPPASGGGSSCSGNNINTAQCYINPVNGGWGRWSPYTSCTKSCGGGRYTRSRACNDPVPANCGSVCSGVSSQTHDCNTHCCPVNGNWGSWKGWSQCSVTCGQGSRRRDRSCNNPAPSCGGAYCTSDSYSITSCNIQPVHGGWGQWSQYNSCTKSCGGGTHTRTRFCNNPSPAKCGNACTGDSSDTKPCNTENCPVDGKWTEWELWSQCSATCHQGVRIRYRNCSESLFGGNNCIGNASDSVECNIKQVHGGWGPWGEFTLCTASCGDGIQSRYRSCNNPVSDYCGEACPGDGQENRQCNNSVCPANTPVPTIDEDYIDALQGTNKTRTGVDKTDLQTGKNTYIIVGTVCAVVLIAAIVAVVIIVKYRRHKNHQNYDSDTKTASSTYETPQSSQVIPGTENAYASLN